MHNFKKGDKVVFDPTARINKSALDWITTAMSEGTVFTVSNASPTNEMIQVEEKPDKNFWHYRFKAAPKVEAKPTKPKRDYIADHARRSLRAAGMTPEQAAKFVKNAQKMKPYGFVPEHVIGTNKVTGHIDLSGLSRMTQPGRVADVVGYAFSWGDAPEGTTYWSGVHSHLLRLASNPQPK